MKTLEAALRANVDGDIYFDLLTRQVYSVDSSIFEVQPLGIVIPRTKADLIRTVEIARDWSVPITVRGAATGITGGCLGQGLIIDVSKYLTRIISVNIEQEYAICEPGVVQDDLNRQLAPHGYRLGPDTSTGNRATLGGMLANNAAGARSLRYGKMSDHVQAVELLLGQGETLNFSSLTQEEWTDKCLLDTREGEIYRTLKQIKETDAEEIRKHYPPLPRRVSGYNLNELLAQDSLNVAKLIAGSEGTLGIATEIRMHIVPKPRVTGLCLIPFSDLIEALRHVPTLLTCHPLSLEMIDDQVIELGRLTPSMRGRLEWLKGHPKALFIVELEGAHLAELEEKLKALQELLHQQKIGEAPTVLLETKAMADVWALRQAGLGILLSKRTYSRALAFLEDLSIPPEKLAPFMTQFCAYLAIHGKTAGIYGHVGSGCMHIRPYIDLRNPEELSFVRQMMLDVSTLVLEVGGALSGEHGDGWIRSWLNPKMFGPVLMQAFQSLKAAFDPLHLMNPGKIIPLTEEWESLRLELKEVLHSPSTFLDFEPEGGFALAVDLCNGNGQCRKKERIMCPSYQVTLEEFHSTRARAQALRAVVHGHLPMQDFTSERMYDVMDLCLSCKGCKTECPSQVDMAKMKSEFLYHYQEEHGYSLRSRLVSHIGQFNRWFSPFAKVFNALSQTTLVKKGMEWVGFSPLRTLPALAPQRFSKWFARYQQPRLSQTVVLLNDTFTEFNHPEIGQAAVKLLNALGYHVLVPPWNCCGRPALSKGWLPYARQQAQKLVETLYNYSTQGLKIIGLEPSCLFTLRDDYLALLPPLIQAKAKQVIQQAFILDEFLAQLVEENKFSLNFSPLKQKVKVHGHCYQKALIGMEATLKALRAVPSFEVEEIAAGCCGMAGSFGYEKEHEELSRQIGELHLLPAVRASAPETWIVANGMSCRHQINDASTHPVLHLAEAMLSHLLIPQS